MSNYPDDVNEAMIDRYYDEGNACCANCRYFNDYCCEFKEYDLKADCEDIAEITDEEYLSFCGVPDDGYCDSWQSV